MKKKKKITRAPKGSGHIRQRSDGSYEGQYYFEGERLSIYGESYDEVRSKLNLILDDIYHKNYSKGCMMPLWVYLSYWAKKYTNLRPGSAPNYRTYIEGHVQNSRIGSTPLKLLTLDDFQAFFNRLKKQGRLDGKPGGLSPKSLRNIYQMMNQALDYAVSHLRFLTTNPMNGVILPKVPKPKIQVMDREDQRKVETCIHQEDIVNELLIYIDLYTGLRIGEITALQWPDIAPDKSSFRITKSLERLYKEDAKERPEYIPLDPHCYEKASKTALYFGPPKTESGKRIVYCIEAVAWALQKIEEYQIENGIYNPKGFVFLTRRGTPYEPDNYRSKVFRPFLARANLAGYTPHSLRHTFATRAFELSIDAPTLASLLGHAQSSTTLNMYGHSKENHRKEAMQKLNSIRSDSSDSESA